MRQDILRKLTEFDEQLLILNENVVEWVNTFVSMHRFDHAEILMNYNEKVMSRISNWASTFRKKMITESVFESDRSDLELENIIERQRTELKTLLDLRHLFLPWGMRNITCSPYMPAHIACVFAVEVVIKETESACLWLMPWVQRVIGSPLEIDIKLSTENAHGKFQTPYYLMASDKKSLIAVKDYCEYIEHHPATADVFFSNNALRVDIEKAFGKPAVNYLKAVQYFHVQRTSNPSVFGFHVFNLAMALHESSVNRLGREYHAKDGYEDALIRFYHFWEGLPTIVRERVAKTRVDGYHHTFEEYLLTLFVTVPSIPLSQETKLRVEALNIIKCSAVISSALFAFIDHYKDWYTLSVAASESEPPLYTTRDLEQLRETFEDAVAGTTSSRIFACVDAFAMSIAPRHQKSYDLFFQLSELLPLLSDTELLKIADNPRKFCENVDEVFSLLSQLPDNQTRSKYWTAFAPIWQPYFREMSEIITLFYMMDFSDTQSLNTLFNENIRGFLTYHTTFSSVVNLPAWCEKLNFSMIAVCQFFVNSILTFSSQLIADPCALVKCFSVFTTALEFQQVLSSAHNALSWLLCNNGKMLLNLLACLEVAQPLNPDEFDVKMLRDMVLRYALPHLVSHQKIEALWESPRTECCGFSFFKKGAKNDVRVHEQLMSVHDHVMKDSITSFEASCERVKILFEYIAENEGAGFLEAVKSGFCKNFFEGMHSLMQAERYQFSPNALT